MAEHTVVSAPGKVLLAGGYLVLDRAYSGLVVSTDSRFYTVISPANGNPNEIRVRSPQFTHASWTYRVNLAESADAAFVQQIAAETDGSTNKFVHLALARTLKLALELTGAPALLVLFSTGLDIAIAGANDFYSQRAALAARALPRTLHSLAHLPPFAPTGGALTAVHKTGLGSSAALIASLCTALLLHTRTIPTLSSPADVRLAHNLAQAVHCLAQGKVGSGFDVASAAFGSQLYTRFTPTVLDPFFAPDAPSLAAILGPANARWDYVSAPVALPPRVRLMLADVDAGSDTPSLVGAVLKWRAANPAKAAEVWGALDTANMAFARALEQLAAMAESAQETYEAGIKHASHLTAEEWLVDLDPESEIRGVMRALHDIHTLANEIRSHMRLMGSLAGVPLEPPEQTRLLDACLARPGVLAGGVPGAGGYDAIWLLVIDTISHDNAVSTGEEENEVVKGVEAVWGAWTEMDVCPLKAAESRQGGLRVERLEEVPGLGKAVHG